jgi:hypothetical protein
MCSMMAELADVLARLGAPAAEPVAGADADVTGYGPLPARIAHDILGDTGGGRWRRRLFTIRARGNYVREMPGWHVELIHDGLGQHPTPSAPPPRPDSPTPARRPAP